MPCITAVGQRPLDLGDKAPPAFLLLVKAVAEFSAGFELRLPLGVLHPVGYQAGVPGLGAEEGVRGTFADPDPHECVISKLEGLTTLYPFTG
jgi:hypothetical protein